MASKDLKANIDAVTTIPPAGFRTSSTTGAAVDITGFEGAVVAFTAGTIADGTHRPRVEDSDDGETWAEVDPTFLRGALAALESGADSRVGYMGSRRFVRAAVDVTGDPQTGGQYAAVVVRGFPRRSPLP